MSRYVAAYDIGSDARRCKVAKALGKWGQRVQESVFSVYIEPDEMPHFRRSIGALLGAEDAFDLFPVDTRNLLGRLRWRREPDRREAVIIVG